MYSTLRLIAPVLAVMLMAAPSFAEDSKPADAPAAPAAVAKQTIAVLNVEMLMRESSAAKSVKDQVEKKQKAFRDELSAKEAALQKEDQELSKQRSVIAQDAFEKKLKEFREKATATQREIRTKKEQMDRGIAEAIGKIQKATTEILKDMAKSKGYDVVIPTQQIVYNDPGLDITDEVMKKLNAKLPKVTVSFGGK